MLRRLTALTTAGWLAACTQGLAPPAGDRLLPGSWGGENAGMIVDDSVAHVHVGCTNGSFDLPVELDGEGRFSAVGSYLIRAYPVAVGPTLPARIEGTLRRDEATFTVIVNDTIEHRTVVLGPARVRHGREPELGPCPICAVPGMP